MRRLIVVLSLLLGACAQADEGPDPDGAPADARAAPIGAHGLRLPASFEGTLPCADCAGIRHHLDLWPDQAYALRREWLDDGETLRSDEVGRWYVDPARSALILYGASEQPIQWEIKAADRLRLLDRSGEPIVSELPYALEGGPLDPTPLELPLSGEFTYLADAALFRECLTGHRWPVAMEGDYPALERAYLEARPEPGAPLLATLEGRVETRPGMEGPPRRTLVVERFSRVHADADCPRDPVGPELTGTLWRLLALQGAPLEGPAGRRAPHLLLLDEGDGGRRFSATAGCNMMSGRWRKTQDGLSFGPARSTLMACPPELAARERALSGALARATGHRLADGRLLLMDAEGQPVLEAEAAYTRF